MRSTRAIAVGTLLLATGCASWTPGARRARTFEGTLTAAGFRALPADTPGKMARLKSFPPRQMHFVTRDGKRYAVYPDPAGCGCAYVGDGAAQQRLEELNIQREITDSERADVRTDRNAVAIDAMNKHESVEAIQRVYDPDGP
jgi:hypothetical protein